MQHEVVVVDNASPDNSASRLRDVFPEANYPNVEIIGSSSNHGFSAANNIGAHRAKGRVLFFLNPDTIVHADAIPRLVQVLDSFPEVGAAGPRILNADGTDQPSTWEFPTLASQLRHYLPATSLLRGEDRRSDPILGVSQQVDVVKGCAIAVRRAALQTVGGWDTSYFMYAEEGELCWSLRKNGYKTYFLREAEITHLGGQSTVSNYASFQVMERRSNLQFLKRHGTAGQIIVDRVAGTIGFAGRAAIFSLFARLRPNKAEEYRRRGAAARALWRWFAFEHA